MAMLFDLPQELLEDILTCLEPHELGSFRCASQDCRAIADAPILWNRYFCRTVWTVDPNDIPDLLKQTLAEDEADVHGVGRVQRDWHGMYKTMVDLEKKELRRLQALYDTGVQCYLERHFIGAPPHPIWAGWERRFWSFEGNMIVAWDSHFRNNCYAQFPLHKNSKIVPLEPPLQGVSAQRDFVFTITNTTFDLYFACPDEKMRQLWLDKVGAATSADHGVVPPKPPRFQFMKA